MGKRPPNSEIGQQNSRAARSLRSRQRAEGVWDDILFIAFRDRPTTNAEYARIFQEEGRPTPSGTGTWTDRLIQRYMSKFGSNPKKLRDENPERSSIGYGYPAEVYASLRAELKRLNEVTERNGRWIPSTDAEPTVHQAVKHSHWGIGDLIECVSLTSLRCRFMELDETGSAVFVERDCRPVDVQLFIFNLTAEQRIAVAAEFWKRSIRDHEQGYRPLTDGWHL